MSRTTEQTETNVFEIVTPRTNAATLTAAENLLAALASRQSLSLEIWATSLSRHFLIRAPGNVTAQDLHTRLGAAYPQADLRPIGVSHPLGDNPLHVKPNEQVAACSLVLQEPPYLPLRTFHDDDLYPDRPAQADPLLPVLAALSNLPDGWRAVSQLVLSPASTRWSKPYRRMAVEPPLYHERMAQQAATETQTSWSQLVLAALFLVFVVASLTLMNLYDHYGRLALVLAAVVVVAIVVGVFWLVRRLTDKPIYDPQLVRDKISHPAYQAQLQLAVFAPKTAPEERVQAILDRLADAYRPFDLPSGNRLTPRRRGSRASILNTRELAGLWHLPLATSDTPLLERTTARRWQPPPWDVGKGCRIGVSELQGRQIPVCLPDDLLQRHLLLVAKTRRGKSALLLRLAQHLVTQPGTLVVVDPHRDLVQATLGLIGRDRQEDVVYLDVANSRRPFGLNLLDVGLGWNRDQAVENALTVLRHEFDRFWGPRMEDAFRFALLTLYLANEKVVKDEGDAGRDRQYTLLDVPPLLAERAFRRRVLRGVDDATVHTWWTSYYDSLGQHFQTEVVNPVQTKVQRFVGSQAARVIVGQPRSTIDPRAWVKADTIVLLHTARGLVGESTAALIGGTIVNLLSLAIRERVTWPKEQRSPVHLLIDEAHTLPSIDYEGILGELAKYGASLTLATQSLGRLAKLDAEGVRDVRGMVFANIDGLFAFHMSAEDARYLAPELGGEVEVADLVELGEHECYVKLSIGGRRLPVFWVRLDPPVEPNLVRAELMQQASVAKHGTPSAHVEAMLLQAVQRRVEAEQAAASSNGHNTADASETKPADDDNPANRRSRRGRSRGPSNGDHRPNGNGHGS
ncbi:MAG: DUF87 domain-containing protein [Anaerolineae bacterium]